MFRHLMIGLFIPCFAVASPIFLGGTANIEFSIQGLGSPGAPLFDSNGAMVCPGYDAPCLTGPKTILKTASASIVPQMSLETQHGSFFNPSDPYGMEAVVFLAFPTNSGILISIDGRALDRRTPDRNAIVIVAHAKATFQNADQPFKLNGWSDIRFLTGALPPDSYVSGSVTGKIGGHEMLPLVFGLDGNPGFPFFTDFLNAPNFAGNQSIVYGQNSTSITAYSRLAEPVFLEAGESFDIEFTWTQISKGLAARSDNSLQAVPEAATSVLMSVALLGLGLYYRRRTRD